MALRNIRKNDDPALYKMCKEVKKFDAKLSELIDDMIETMNDADGVGLAAPQVGVLRRVVVIDVGDGGYVVRPNWVKVEAYDRNGDLYEYEGEGLFARAVFHETDHLDGKVYKRLISEPPAGWKEDE